ncbi:hypothetical protein H312_01760 [Anncaliia algerae PRA339]|uniref:Major facilitator superfamily (MFS) profile domain-containing protein n=1 Tax=Anncaliia algerae PRA339 TaxID=1288291 RepID=A0A059F0I4_9MICR|nr:hypothetical protein H312_01760 [Anncaliia algerae PRA339]
MVQPDQSIEMMELNNTKNSNVSNKRNSIKKVIDSIAVSLIGLGFGFAITVSTLVDHWRCKNMNINYQMMGNTSSVATMNFTGMNGMDSGNKFNPGLSYDENSMINATLNNAETSTTNMNMVSNNMGRFMDLYLINDMNCIASGTFSFYIACIFLAAMIATISVNLTKIPRKLVLVVSSLLFCAGFLANACAMTFASLAIISRFLTGFGIGLGLTAMVPYIKDNATKKSKDILSVIAPTNIALGCLVTTLFAMVNFTSIHSYRCIFITYGIFFLFLSFYLLKIEDIEKEPESQMEDTETPKKIPTLQLFKDNIKPLIANILLHISQQWCMVNGVLMFSNEIFKDSNVRGEFLVLDPVVGSVILTLINFVGNFISAIWCQITKDKIVIYSFSHVFALICLFFLGASVQPAFFTILFIAAFSFGLGPMVWAIGPELFNNDFRKIGISVGNMVNWISSFLIPYIYGLVADSPMQRYLFFLGATILTINAIVLFFLLDLKKAFKSFMERLKF